jgi:chromosome segregation ATPase
LIGSLLWIALLAKLTMLNLFSSLTVCHNDGWKTRGKKKASATNVDFNKSFKSAYDPELSHIDESQLVNSMLMVENLTEALEKPRLGEDDTSVHTGSLSGGSIDGLREQLGTLSKEKRRLRQQCRELEHTVSETRRDSDLWKLKTTMAMGNMRSRIECLEEDKQCLLEKCEAFESKLLALKIENVSKQEDYSALNKKVASSEKCCEQLEESSSDLKTRISLPSKNGNV